MFQNQRSLRERIRDFQKNYKLADDDLIMILIASLENELRELKTLNTLFTQAFSIRLEQLEGLLRNFESHFNSEELKEIERELARTVAVVDRLKGIPLISIVGAWIVSGIFLFSWGKFEGRSETLRTVQEVERWAKTSEGQALRELGRLNPHLLDCAGQGLEKIRLEDKTICKPVGGSRGWILPP